MKLVKFLDVTEDKIRFTLSKQPIIYAFISGIGTVLFFRGVWMLADQFSFMNALVTLGLSLVILLLTGSFVYHFINNEVVISGLKKEKKLVEKNAEQIKAEFKSLKQLSTKLDRMDKKLNELQKKSKSKIYL